MSDKNDNNKNKDTDLTINGGVNTRMIVIGRPPKEKLNLPEQMAVLPIRDTVLFPGCVVTLTVTRPATREIIDKAGHEHSLLAIALQNEGADAQGVASFDQIHHCAVAGRVVKLLTMGEGSQMVVIHGIERVELLEPVDQPDGSLVCRVARAKESRLSAQQKEKFPALVSSLRDAAIDFLMRQDPTQVELCNSIRNSDDNPFTVNYIANNIQGPPEKKYALLAVNNIFQRAEMLLALVNSGIEFLKVKDDIQNKARTDLDKRQREAMLMQLSQTIQNELGDNPQKSLIEKFKEKALGKKWPQEVAEAFERELEKFARLNSNAAEYGMTQNYLDTVVSLPWGEYSDDNHDLNRAEDILNSEHYGLEKVKERIVEHLAVLKLKGDLKSPILCLYGPPGVGKTSLGKSIAQALGRKYVRVSLGGMHDEAEIRGHRRTYIGSMPGRIIEGIRNAGTANPVFILDEIDKVSSDFRGDPAAALLEVLDPEQNSAFHDNFLDLDFDLSKVLFIATANNTGTISTPLLDRMELIPVDGYLLEEKVQIALKHLLPKEMANHGIKPDTFSLSAEVLEYIISKYTRESGVRTLDKVLATLCRKVALRVAKEQEVPAQLSCADVRQMLGVEKFDHDIWHDDLRAGVVTGLAWTAVGGEILFVECARSAGSGKMTLTGNLGDVMKESAILALEYVRSNAEAFGLQDVDFDKTNFHIHVPEGAVPKDGPSAGITMVTAIVSALTGRRVRKRLAMTGEITLRGMVIPVGGITEKILAAKRAGITEIILCKQNKKDLDEIKKEYVDGLTFHLVDRIAEVIDIALEK